MATHLDYFKRILSAGSPIKIFTPLVGERNNHFVATPKTLLTLPAAQEEKATVMDYESKFQEFVRPMVKTFDDHFDEYFNQLLSIKINRSLSKLKDSFEFETAQDDNKDYTEVLADVRMDILKYLQAFSDTTSHQTPPFKYDLTQGLIDKERIVALVLEDLSEDLEALKYLASHTNRTGVYQLRWAVTKSGELRMAREGRPSEIIPAHYNLTSDCIAAGLCTIKGNTIITIDNGSQDFQPDIASIQHGLRALFNAGIFEFPSTLTICTFAPLNTLDRSFTYKSEQRDFFFIPGDQVANLANMNKKSYDEFLMNPAIKGIYSGISASKPKSAPRAPIADRRRNRVPLSNPNVSTNLFGAHSSSFFPSTPRTPATTRNSPPVTEEEEKISPKKLKF